MSQQVPSMSYDDSTIN